VTVVLVLDTDVLIDVQRGHAPPPDAVVWYNGTGPGRSTECRCWTTSTRR
jgi:hypothetical protein